MLNGYIPYDTISRGVWPMPTLRFFSWLPVSFAVTIFLSGLTGSELCLFKNLSQSVSQSVSQSGED